MIKERTIDPNLSADGGAHLPDGASGVSQQEQQRRTTEDFRLLTERQKSALSGKEDAASVSADQRARLLDANARDAGAYVRRLEGIETPDAIAKVTVAFQRLRRAFASRTNVPSSTPRYRVSQNAIASVVRAYSRLRGVPVPDFSKYRSAPSRGGTHISNDVIE